jgi:hypothetical protein
MCNAAWPPQPVKKKVTRYCEMPRNNDPQTAPHPRKPEPLTRTPWKPNVSHETPLKKLIHIQSSCFLSVPYYFNAPEANKPMTAQLETGPNSKIYSPYELHHDQHCLHSAVWEEFIDT